MVEQEFTTWGEAEPGKEMSEDRVYLTCCALCTICRGIPLMRAQYAAWELSDKPGSTLIRKASFSHFYESNSRWITDRYKNVN